MVLAVALLSLVWWSAVGATSPCPFNPLCSCSNLQRDVSCIGVPFAEVPSLPSDDLFQLTLLKAGLEVLHDHSFQNTRISSLRMMQNQLSLIHSKAFQGSERALTTLDLSFNWLHRMPTEALQRLHHLQWLSLHGNSIDEVSRLSPQPGLRSLFLGDNRLASLGDGAFAALGALASLDLDHNCLASVERGAFPSSLNTLSLANNLLTTVPPLHNLRNLTWLQLGGNLIEELPQPLRLPVAHLHKLDLSHNLLTELPPFALGSNSSFSVSNLHLEFNYLKTVSVGAFGGGLAPERLSLSNNRFSSLPDGAFEGLRDVLKALDLSHNLLNAFPKAVKDLSALTHLYLRGNLIDDLDPYDLYGCRYDLEVLDLSGNRLRRIPRKALLATQRVARLSLQDNVLSGVEAGELAVWGRSLTALNLANNRLRRLAPGSFDDAVKLRELRLSYNPLLALDPQVLAPLKASLEVLEAGTADVPLDVLQGMEKVKWLQLDHNNLLHLSPTTFSGTGSLIHVDLEGNRLRSLPPGLFKGTSHTRLISILLAHNHLSELEGESFRKLPALTSVMLLGNRIGAVREKAFSDLPLLSTVVLASNHLQTLEKAAFSNLRSLTNMFLQDNNLTEFSLDSFHQVGDPKNQLLVDVSRNRLERLVAPPQEGGEGVHVRTLDLSDNRLGAVEGDSLRPIARSLHTLVLSRNRLSFLDTSAFRHLVHLQVLHLDGNLLSNMGNGVFQNCAQLQSLNAAHNNLSALFPGCLRNLSALRILDLSYNALKTLPEAVFLGTSLERLNLSNNNIFHAPIHALGHVRSTLRYLDLSCNRISTIPTHGLNHLHGLLSLNISSNKLTSLSDDAFSKLVYLLHLDLSHNTLFRLDDELFKALVSLQTLVLRDASLASVPSLPLPSLRSLDLSGNLLVNLSSASFSGLKSLRRLDLSRNHLGEVPTHVWPAVGGLTSLDISRNPVQTLPMNAFKRLERLRELDLRGLDLKYLDARVLHPLKFLSLFRTSTCAGLRSFRLQHLLSRASGLRRVHVEVEEATLSHQLQWTFGAKLRELVVTGHNLHTVLPDAFQGLRTHELTLRITGTSVSRLPAGLLRYLADIRYLTLDLRDNLLTSMEPSVLQPPVLPHDTTQHISGGVLLDYNPWVCGCGLVWLGGWMRRWMRETLRVQMLHFDGFLYAQTLARQALCTLPGTNSTMPIVDLDPEEMGCTGEGEVSGAMSSSLVAPPLLMLWLLLMDHLFACAYRTL